MKSSTTIVLDKVLDVLFPRYCEGCGKTGGYLCSSCTKSKLAYLPPDEISIQSEYPLADIIGITAYNKFLERYLTDIKYEMYYKMLDDLYPVIGNFLTDRKWVKELITQFDMITYVPLSKKRMRWRGFNQSELLARHLSSFVGVPCLKLLNRTTHARPQMGLSRAERLQNVHGAFDVIPGQKSKIYRARILIVDDVVTTGATLNHCAKVLHNSGAAEVMGFVLARA